MILYLLIYLLNGLLIYLIFTLCIYLFIFLLQGPVGIPGARGLPGIKGDRVRSVTSLQSTQISHCFSQVSHKALHSSGDITLTMFVAQINVIDT